jgi:uncharacterized protein YcbK (DUF882 family)
MEAARGEREKERVAGVGTYPTKAFVNVDELANGFELS